MAGGIGGGLSGGLIKGVSVGGVTTTAALPPNNQISPDDVFSLAKPMTSINAKNAADISVEGVQNARDILAGQSFRPGTVADNTAFITDSLAQVGVEFSPVDNPLNQYANYTYHIRWFMTDESSAYNNISKTNPSGDSINKTVIAESGVTAGFNITEFEFENTCGPQQRTLNTAATSWTMVITEPYGISLIDKMRAAAKTQPVINYMRAPYFIDIWFTGYDESGKILSDKLFYQLYRVNILDMDIDLTEGGSRYTITGIFDNDIGFGNDVSIPQATLTIQAKTVGSFFTQLATQLTEQQKKSLQQDFANVVYKIRVPPELRNWTFRASDVANQDNRNDDMSIEYTEGTMNISINLGTSIENIVNRVISMCPEADPWVKGETNGGTASATAAELTSNGMASWLMVHSDIKIIGFNAYTRDYIREVTYTLVRYRTARTGADAATLNSLESASVQREKINFLKNQNALKKLYQYIYTGQNTEVLKFDIHVENFWAITLPSWEGTNTYSNYTQGLLQKDNAIADAIRQGTYSKSQILSVLQNRLETIQQSINNVDQGFRNALLTEQEALKTDVMMLETSSSAAVLFNQETNQNNNRDRQGTLSPGELVLSETLAQDKNVTAQVAEYATFLNSQKALKYAEDLKILPAKYSDPMQVVLKPDNEPSGQNAAQSGDSNKSVANPNSYGVPSGRSFIGTILGNMFDGSFFNEVNLEIRGDPYWMGQSNIRQGLIADSYGQSGNDGRFANYQVCDHMFVLVFRSGENYNESTGMMQFTDTSDFFNGAYGVLDVKNSFKNGSFTQTLHAAKDIFAQKVSNEVSAAAVSNVNNNATGATPPAVTESGVIDTGGVIIDQNNMSLF